MSKVEIWDPYDDMQDKPKKESNLVTDQLQSDIEMVLDTAAGRRFVSWVLAEAHILHHGFTGQSNSTIFVCGQQSTGLKVLAQVKKVRPQFFAELMDDITKVKESKNG